MKTNKSVSKTILGLGVAFALAMSLNARADEPMKPMKGGEHQLMLLKEVKTTRTQRALRDDDTMAMVCSKVQNRVDYPREAGREGRATSDGRQPAEGTDRHARVRRLQFHHHGHRPRQGRHHRTQAQLQSVW